MIKDVLNNIYDEIATGDVQVGMESLINELRDIKNNSNDSEWKSFIESCLSHPLKELIHNDPFTSRSYNKPRGYPGDAVLIDMIYFPQKMQFDNVSDIGKQIFKYTSNSSACRAVRYRKYMLAKTIDALTNKIKKPKIMSVACGHLREAEISEAVKSNLYKEFIAIDYDKISLKHIETVHNNNGHNIKPLHLSIHDILKGKANLDKDFDLIYSAGLYDYLNQKTAKNLSSLLFDMLSPNGQLLIANFLPGIKDIGYMETYMGWNLIFRDEMQLVDIVRAIPRNRINKIEIFSEEEENIIFLTITKSA